MLKDFISYSLSILSCACAAVLALAPVACSSESTWEPGPGVKADVQQVRFVDDGSSTHIIMPGFDVSNQVVHVRRSVTAGRLVVPIEVLSATEGLVIPESVTFEDGESDATFEVALREGLTSGSYKYYLRLASDEVDPYTSLDGVSSFRGTISFAIPLRAQLWVTGYDTRIGTWAEDILDMGEGDYLFPDFCHSGYALRLHIDGQNYVAVYAYRATLPTFSYDYGNFVYLYDNAAGAFVECYPHGTDSWVTITEITFFNGIGDYKSYGRYFPKQQQFTLTLGRLRTITDAEEVTYQTLNVKIMPEGEEPAVVEPAKPQG